MDEEKHCTNPLQVCMAALHSFWAVLMAGSVLWAGLGTFLWCHTNLCAWDQSLLSQQEKALSHSSNALLDRDTSPEVPQAYRALCPQHLVHFDIWRQDIWAVGFSQEVISIFCEFLRSGWNFWLSLCFSDLWWRGGCWLFLSVQKLKGVLLRALEIGEIIYCV